MHLKTSLSLILPLGYFWRLNQKVKREMECMSGMLQTWASYFQVTCFTFSKTHKFYLHMQNIAYNLGKQGCNSVRLRWTKHSEDTNKLKQIFKALFYLIRSFKIRVRLKIVMRHCRSCMAQTPPHNLSLEITQYKFLGIWQCIIQVWLHSGPGFASVLYTVSSWCHIVSGLTQLIAHSLVWQRAICLPLYHLLIMNKMRSHSVIAHIVLPIHTILSFGLLPLLLHCVRLICRTCSPLWRNALNIWNIFCSFLWPLRMFDNFVSLEVVFRKQNSEIQLGASVSLSHSFFSERWSRKWKCIVLYCLCVLWGCSYIGVGVVKALGQNMCMWIMQYFPA